MQYNMLVIQKKKVTAAIWKNGVEGYSSSGLDRKVLQELNIPLIKINLAATIENGRVKYPKGFYITSATDVNNVVDYYVRKGYIVNVN